MKNFEKTLYEALLVAFGRILSKYNTFAQGSILKDVGKEIIDYLNHHGFQFKEEGTIEDLATLMDLFVKNGFAESLEIQPADKGNNFIWRSLYGIEAYKELHEIAENPFLACPLNLCLYYIADKHQKTMVLHKKSFDMEHQTAESQYELVDKAFSAEQPFDALVIENARLYELAKERAERLENAQKEIKTLKGILPICACCKKIRDDKGYWQQVEVYIEQHSEADFSHGYCPECYEKAMREMLAIEEENNTG